MKLQILFVLWALCLCGLSFPKEAAAEGSNPRYTRENAVIDIGTYFDTDGDNCISLQEIEDYWYNHISPWAREFIHTALREDPSVFMKNCDHDIDGRICVDDFILAKETCLNGEKKIMILYEKVIDPLEKDMDAQEKAYRQRVRGVLRNRLETVKRSMGVSEI